MERGRLDDAHQRLVPISRVPVLMEVRPFNRLHIVDELPGFLCKVPFRIRGVIDEFPDLVHPGVPKLPQLRVCLPVQVCHSTCLFVQVEQSHGGQASTAILGHVLKEFSPSHVLFHSYPPFFMAFLPLLGRS